MARRLLACAAAALLCARASAQVPFQELDFEGARAAAQKDGKAILVDFCTSWSPTCKTLDSTTWKDERVHRWLGEKTIAITVDSEKAFLLARRYRVREYPTLLFLNAGGLELGRLSGLVDADAFLAGGEQALATANAHRLARKAHEANPTDPIARMNYALSLSLQGRYAEALDHYVWCYQHGIANDDGFAGVRESILLDEIERLGSAYPAATSAIAELARAIGVQILEGTAGDRDLRDYVALCNRASLAGDMLELFDRLKDKGEVALSQRKVLASVLFETLVERRRYIDVYASAPDMTQELAQRITRHSNLKSQYARNRAGNNVEAAAVESAREETLRLGSQYFEVSLGVGQFSVANRLADRLLTFAPEAATYERLVRHALRAGASEAARAVAKRADATPTLSAVEKSRIRRASVAPPGAH